MTKPPRKQKLSELSVRSLKPEAAAYVVWDTRQQGLAVRVQPTGAASFYLVYSLHNRVRWYHIGSVNKVGLAEARKLAAEIMLAVIKGGDPAAERKAERGAGTFTELASRYVETYAKRFNKSWQHSNGLVQRYALPRLGKLQAATISRADIKAMVARIKAPILANQVLAAVSAVFSWAVKEEIVASNPCKGVKRNETRSRERVLADSEVPVFWAAFEEAGFTGLVLKTLLLLGQRPGEVAAMRHEHIKDGWWEMPGQPVPELGWPGTKNGQSHRLWLPKPVVEIIAGLDAGATTGPVFEGVSVPMLSAAMREIVAKLKVERATPHDLRRSHGTTITGLKFGRDAMNRIQNHVEGGIADVYDQHDYSVEIKTVMEAVAAKLMALATGEVEDKVVPLRR